MYYQVPVEVGQQGDGLWRAEAPHLKGCWVDAPTMEEAITEINEVIAMVLDVYRERSWSLPEEVIATPAPPLHATIPVASGEGAPRRRSKASATRPK